MIDPRSAFLQQLQLGSALCLLPLSRVKVEQPTRLSDELTLYPQGSLNPLDFRIVSFPAYEWREAERRAKVLTPGTINATGSGLAWLKSAATGLSVESFFDHDIIAFPLAIDWPQLWDPETHDAHLELISAAQARAEATLDLVRFHYCRADLPATLPGRAGFLPSPRISTALFYSLKDHEAYVIAGETVTHSVSAGLGLELDHVPPVGSLGKGETGNVARHALRLRTMALEAADDTAKFIQLMTLIEFIANPFAYTRMQDVRKVIALHVAQSRSEYDRISEDFKFLTSNPGPTSTSNSGLRHNLVHVGKRLEDMISKKERGEVFRRLDHYAGTVIQLLVDLSSEEWSKVIAFREERKIELKLFDGTRREPVR